ncbi:unnamed protein product, partial [Citrullus colocynthis]
MSWAFGFGKRLAADCCSLIQPRVYDRRLVFQSSLTTAVLVASLAFVSVAVSFVQLLPCYAHYRLSSSTAVVCLRYGKKLVTCGALFGYLAAPKSDFDEFW